MFRIIFKIVSHVKWISGIFFHLRSRYVLGVTVTLLNTAFDYAEVKKEKEIYVKLIA